jgi:hypothetical protein
VRTAERSAILVRRFGRARAGNFTDDASNMGRHCTSEGRVVVSPFPPPPMPDPVASPRSALETSAKVIAAVFLTVGIAGLLSRIDGDAAGFFVVGMTVLLSVVHVGFGVAGLLSARSVTPARWFLIGGGVLYLILVLTGPVAPITGVPLDSRWWQAGLAIAMIILGAVLP